MAEELELRTGPLRLQWEARGPGMLRTIGELTEPELIVPSADVILVYPALGGGGDAQLPNNTVRIEAVLANQVTELPETVRLGWMLAQLHLDVPMYGENVHIDRLPHVARFAMLVPALQAAEEVELVQLHSRTRSASDRRLESRSSRRSRCRRPRYPLVGHLSRLGPLPRSPGSARPDAGVNVG